MMRVKRLFLLASLFTGSVAAAASKIPLRNDVLDQGEFLFGYGGAYLRTTGNFNEKHDRVNLDNSAAFQSFSSNLFLQYAPVPSLTLLANMEYVYNLVDAHDPAGTGIHNATGGFGDSEIGVRFRTNEKPLRIVLDGSIQFPLYSRMSPNNWASLGPRSEVPLGNGVTEYNLGGTAELPFAEDFWGGVGFGYTLRSSGFSSYLPWRVYVKYDEPRGLFARFGLLGQITATEDQFTGKQVNERSTAVIGGSQAYNAINPTFLKLDAAVGAYLGKSVFLNFGLQLPFTGTNVPREPVYAAVIGFDIGGKPRDSGYSKSNRGFQQYYMTAKVLQSSQKLKQAIIDKGRGDGIKMNELLDVFEPDQPNGAFGDTLARAKVIEAGPTRSKLQIMEFFKDGRVQEGFVVRRPVR